jgi:hypothetical protein
MRYRWSILLIAVALILTVGIISCANHQADQCRDRGGIVDRFGRYGEFVHCQTPPTDAGFAGNP